MRKLQLVNIIIISILLLFSMIGLIGVGFGQIIETIMSGGSNDDGYIFLPVLAATIFLVVYLVSAIKLYIKRTEPDRLILWACWINTSMIVLFLLGLILIVSTFYSSYNEGGYLTLFVGIILSVAMLLFVITSYVLFIIGKKKSLNLTNIN